MSYPNQPNNNNNNQSSQNCPQYPPSHYPSTVYHNTQARGQMNPQGHPTIHYADPQSSGYLQSSPLQSNPTQQQQQNQQGYILPTQIATPPLVVAGVFHPPNSSPFTTIPRTEVQANTSPPPPRYQCDKCGNTFSRLHDRNRHYESTHSDNPPQHKCDKCKKQFSRADAKKRHQDDGRCANSP